MRVLSIAPLFLGLITALATACMQNETTAAGIRSSVETVTWSDAKPAYSIKCDAPDDCMERSLQMCRSTFGNYQVLRSTNMPTVGNQREVRGPASVVIRCG